ncbi:MAG: HAMP domain-containing protein [Ardenticatenales bacterium]|nr:HAMP domain-containing protein [Ardenticatenales bacterium]
MRPFSLTTLRIQAVLWTLLPLTLIFLLVGSVGVYAYAQVVNSLVKDRDRELSRLSADWLSENLLNHAELLKALTENEGMQPRQFADEGTLTAGQHGLLQTAIKRGLLSSFDGGVTLLNVEGEIVVSMYSVQTSVAANQALYASAYRIPPPGHLYDEAAFFYIPRQTMAPYFSDVIHQPDDPFLSEPQIILSYPITDDQGRFVGVLAGSFLLVNETLGKEMAKLGIGTSYLVDRQGRVIWHGTEAYLGQDFSSHSPVQALLRMTNAANAQTDVDEDGNTIVIGYAPVKVTDWGLVIQEPWESVIGPVRTFQWMMLGTLLLGVALVMVIISSGTRRLTDPIKELVSQTLQVSEGDFAGHVQGGTIDEMRVLAHAFNEMADRVAKYRVGLQSYVAAITHSQEEERKRIARELHDDTIQSLIALGRRLELMEQSLENPIDAAKQLYQLQQMLTRTVAEVRQFSRDLRPLLLEDVGLEAALRQMLREMERHEGVENELVIEGSFRPDELDDELEVTIYRITQEALNNIRKHANASRVSVTLSFLEGAVRLVVRDDGQGFSLAEADDLAQRGSFGLMGIRERARLFGGVFEVESEPGEGTCVSVQLPLSVAPEWVLEGLEQSAISGQRSATATT